MIGHMLQVSLSFQVMAFQSKRCNLYHIIHILANPLQRIPWTWWPISLDLMIPWFEISFPGGPQKVPSWGHHTTQIFCPCIAEIFDGFKHTRCVDILLGYITVATMKALNSLEFCPIPWTPGHVVKFMDNPGNPWTVGKHVFIVW